jgi:hypothetical protein
MAIGLVLGVAMLADIIEPELEKVGNKIGMTVWEGILGPENVPDVRGWLASLPWPFGPKDTPDFTVGPFEHLLGGDSDPEFRAAGESAAAAYTDGLTSDEFTKRTADAAAAGLAAGEPAVTAAAGEMVGGVPDAAAAGLAAGQGTVTAGAETMVDGVAGAVGGAAGDAKAAAGEIPGGIADGIQSKRDLVTNAFASLKAALKNELSPAKEMARTIGFLTSKALADGLKSKDPVVKARAQELKEVAEARLVELRETGTKVGKAAGENLKDGLHSKNPAIKAEAQRVKELVTAPLQNLQAQADNYGQRTGNAYASGLRATSENIKRAAQRALLGAQRVLTATSPPGPDSPLHKIDVWGERTGATFGEGLAYGIEDAGKAVTKAVGGLAGMFKPGVPQGLMPSAGVPTPMGIGAPTRPDLMGRLGGLADTVGKSAGDTYNIKVPVEGLVRARDTFEIARELRRLADLGALSPKKPGFTNG